MQLALPGRPHLTYCTNVHVGESWSEIAAALKQYLPGIKARISPERPMGLGLRLSARAAEELSAPTSARPLQGLPRRAPALRFHGQCISLRLLSWHLRQRAGLRTRLADAPAPRLHDPRRRDTRRARADRHRTEHQHGAGRLQDWRGEFGRCVRDRGGARTLRGPVAQSCREEGLHDRSRLGTGAGLLPRDDGRGHLLFQGAPIRTFCANALPLADGRQRPHSRSRAPATPGPLLRRLPFGGRI